jgi:hypothetical protein
MTIHHVLYVRPFVGRDTRPGTGVAMPVAVEVEVSKRGTRSGRTGLKPAVLVGPSNLIVNHLVGVAATKGQPVD